MPFVPAAAGARDGGAGAVAHASLGAGPDSTVCLRRRRTDEKPPDAGKARSPLGFEPLNERIARSPQEPDYGEPSGRLLGDLWIGEDGVWFEERIDADWRVAYRLLPQDGQPVVGEVRVFPAEPTHNRRPGTWSGSGAPGGGLPADVLRRVRVRTPLQGLSRSDRRKLAAAWGAAYERVGFGGVDTSEVSKTRARFAAAYEVAAARSGKPVQIVAAALERSPTYVRDVLHDAREVGYLTSSGRRGKSGGALTAKGRAQLTDAEHRRLRRLVEDQLGDTNRRKS